MWKEITLSLCIGLTIIAGASLLLILITQHMDKENTATKPEDSEDSSPNTSKESVQTTSLPTLDQPATSSTTTTTNIAPAASTPSTHNELPLQTNTPTAVKPMAEPVLSPLTAATQAPEPVITKPLSWGVFAGSNPSTIADFEKRVSENPDYLAYFIHWGNGNGALPKFLSEYAYEKDRTLVIFWEASDYIIGGTDQPDFSYRAILRGDWDSYFVDFNHQLSAYRGPIILIPFSELNGNWTPWSGTKNGNTPAEAVAAFRYVHGFFAKTSNVKIGWAVNSVSVPQTAENQIDRYYPGDAYVDIVGVDGFNMGDPWLSFDQIFNNSLTTVSQYKKPVFLFSFGTAPGPEKAAWLNDALNNQLPKYPLVEGWIYFNQNKERNWLLWSDAKTFEVFTKYISE